MSHVTRTPLSRSKGQRSRSPGRFAHYGLNASGSCSGERGNVLGVGNYCYVAVCSAPLAALGASAPTEGGKGRGISWRLPAYSLLFSISFRISEQQRDTCCVSRDRRTVTYSEPPILICPFTVQLLRGLRRAVYNWRVKTFAK